ncbi:MAG: hypothetical protein R3343_10800 [Nitriliruptorales bacterium]|nr:hypothetical protein [Nitriliruptorales bacterium]
MRRFATAVLTAALAVSLVAAAPNLDESVGGADPTDATTAPMCDGLDETLCLLPFPNDLFTVADPSTATGRRVAFDIAAMPRNGSDHTTGHGAGGEGKPVDPTEWNRNDGFSPGSPVLTLVPGLDLHQTWGTTDEPHSEVGPFDPGPFSPERGESYYDHRDHIADIARYGDPDAPIVIWDATDDERHAFWSELDLHPQTTDDRRLLILRPAVNFEEGHRYVVGLRNLRDSDGNIISPSDAFTSLRDAALGDDPSGRATHYADAIFPELEQAGVTPDELYLAWDFTVASADNLAGRVLSMRDEAFGMLGDTDLADLEVDGDAPEFSIDYIDEEDGNSAWVVHGAVTVPNFLTLENMPVDPSRMDRDGHEVPMQMAPGTRLFYDRTDGDDPVYGDGLPDVNPQMPTLEAPFVCAIPKTAVADDGTVAEPAIPVLYGHGLLGQRLEGAYWSGGRHLLINHNAMNCGVDWIGMAQQDIANVATILVDGSNFPSLADRAQQGFLNFLYVGRAMIHPDGFVSNPAFQDDNGDPLIDTDELFYDGNSQGAIMGGALTAIAPDFTKAVLGVPGMNYSTLLNRSVDWEGSYAEIFYAAYQDPAERQLMFALMQMLWDRAETNGYAHHMTDDPYPNTPAHTVLLHAAYGDFQVANVSAEVEARTIGARVLANSIPARHWSVDPGFGLNPFRGAHRGSALVYFDSGNLTPPNGNLAPHHIGDDPHGDPRNDNLGGVQKRRFFDTGVIQDTRHSQPYWHRNCEADGQPVPCPDGHTDAE